MNENDGKQTAENLKVKSTHTNPSAGSFGTFKGVFTPSILTILGVIMYLRLGWVLGNAGLIGTLFIVTLSSSITFLTGLSISATATNMRVGGGGAYYMISRALGVEAGAAIGIPLYFAQAIGVSFYVAGFSEAVHSFIPWLDPRVIGVASLVLITALAYLSADLALKSQYAILAIICLSLVSFFMGQAQPVVWPAIDEVANQVGFWTAFAVFFPAVTGIEAGLAMSGELKNPAKALPLGTLGAVVVGLLIYLAIPIVLSMRVPAEVLRADPLVVQKTSWIPWLVVLGVLGATLSSAMGALLGAPRTLKALADDRVLLSFLGKTTGTSDQPRTATLITFFVALIGVLLGDLNLIAPVLSMFFLASYGMLNLTAGVEQLIGNPSWRPTFRVSAWASLLGAFGCCFAMFMIDAGATFISGFLVIGVYYAMQRRNMRAHWGDMRRGILMYLARFSISKLAMLPPHARTWRPHILVLSGSPTNRWYLIQFADALSHGKGFLTVATIVSKESTVKFRVASLEKSIADYLNKRHVTALVKVHVADDVMQGAYALVQASGIGPLVPNTLLLGGTKQEENFFRFAELIMFTYLAKRNVVIFRECEPALIGKKQRNIDVWWGRERQNAGLMLALGYMIQVSPDWAGSQLTLKSVVTKQEEVANAEAMLRKLADEGRLDLSIEVLVVDTQAVDVFGVIQESSSQADLVFLGMRPPDEQETVENYANYYRHMLDVTEEMPPTAIVIAAEEVVFSEIFA